MNDVVNRAKEYIAKCAPKFTNPSDVANQVGCTLEHLSRSFRKHNEKSPQKYIDKQKLKYAKGMLLKTNMSINSIYQTLGYPNHSAFSSWFKRQTHYTPSDYRMAHSKKFQKNIK